MLGVALLLVQSATPPPEPHLLAGLDKVDLAKIKSPVDCGQGLGGADILVCGKRKAMGPPPMSDDFEAGPVRATKTFRGGGSLGLVGQKRRYGSAPTVTLKLPF